MSGVYVATDYFLALPDDLIDCVLVHHGPLRLARDRATVAAVRLQRFWRAVQPHLVHGARVEYRLSFMRRWAPGTILETGNGCVLRRDDLMHRIAYVFLTNAREHVRLRQKR